MVLHVSHNRQKAQPIVCTYWYSIYVYGYKRLQNAPLAVYVVDPVAPMQFSITMVCTLLCTVCTHSLLVFKAQSYSYISRTFLKGQLHNCTAPCIHLYVYTRYIMCVLYMLHAYSQVYIYIHTCTTFWKGWPDFIACAHDTQDNVLLYLLNIIHTFTKCKDIGQTLTSIAS